mgnify:CR=1 FL=1
MRVSGKEVFWYILSQRILKEEEQEICNSIGHEKFVCGKSKYFHVCK